MVWGFWSELQSFTLREMAYAVKWKAMLSVNCTPQACVIAKFSHNETQSVSIHAPLGAIHENEVFNSREHKRAIHLKRAVLYRRYQTAVLDNFLNKFGEGLRFELHARRAVINYAVV